ncbi:MAG: hypothetical protein Q8N08_04425 [Methanobacteriaceae archaeon]|nr:hypothetical protein [Methanobacteriaceae archaeon]
MGRLFKSYKSRLAADMAHDRLQGYGSVKKNGNYYILSIYTSETVELLLNDDTFLSYTEDMDEKLSRIIWDYVWAGKADPRRQKELRQKAYERLKLYYHPNLHVEEPAYELPDADEMVNEYF